MATSTDYVVLPLEVISGERRYGTFNDGVRVAMARTLADGKPRVLVMILDETTAPMPISTTAVSAQGAGDGH